MCQFGFNPLPAAAIIENAGSNYNAKPLSPLPLGSVSHATLFSMLANGAATRAWFRLQKARHNR
jgi:hypothetical protein